MINGGGKNQIFLNLERYKAMFLQEIYKYNYVYDNWWKNVYNFKWRILVHKWLNRKNYYEIS